MTKFYLVRKAASTPEDGQPEELWPLSAAGQDTARKLVEVLGPLGIQHIYSSSERSAIETVKPLAQVYGLKLLVLSELKEHKIESNETAELSPLRVKVWEEFDYVPDSFESSRIAQGRIIRVIQSLMLHHQEEIVVVSLQSNAIALFLNAIDPSFTLQTWKDRGVPEILLLSREEYKLAWTQVDTQREAGANRTPNLSLVGKKHS